MGPGSCPYMGGITVASIVFAKTNSVVAFGGRRVPIAVGEPWDADDALVSQYPDLFAENVRAVRTTTDPRGFRELEQQVEQATRRPGEKRTSRRG